jgi:hypothetical protein
MNLAVIELELKGKLFGDNPVLTSTYEGVCKLLFRLVICKEFGLPDPTPPIRIDLEEDIARIPVLLESFNRVIQTPDFEEKVIDLAVVFYNNTCLHRAIDELPEQALHLMSMGANYEILQFISDAYGDAPAPVVKRVKKVANQISRVMQE